METIIFLAVVGVVIWIIASMGGEAKTPNDNDPKGELPDITLEQASEIIQECWANIHLIAQGNDQRVVASSGQGFADKYRKVIIQHGEKKAFFLLLSQEDSAIPSRMHSMLHETFYCSGYETFETIFLGNLGKQFQRALPLEAKSGNFGHAPSNEADLADRSRILLGNNQNGEPIFHTGEGHLITVAPTGAGKGQCHILPNLYDYNGSVFVLDVKGENERLTGLHRFRYGNSFTFAPYAKTSDHYNPLDFVKSWSDCREMADWLMVPTSKSDGYFEKRGRELLAAILFFVITEEPVKKRHMRRVCSVIWSGTDMLKETWKVMENSGHEMLAESAQDMRSTFENAPKEFSGIINSAKASLEIWREPEVAAVTSDTEDGWHPANLRNSPANKESIVRDGGCEGMSAEKLEELKHKLGMSIFLNVPVGKIKQMASLIRVFVGQHIREIIKTSDDAAMQYGHGEPSEGLPTAPIMFMLDEFPQLGFMKVIEETLEIGRSYKIRLWLFAQDMGQLGRFYPNPKGIIANCAVQSFMNLNDNETAKYVSERLGMVRPIMGEKRPRADLPTLMGEDFNDNFICLKRNQKPLKLTKQYAYKAERYKAYMQEAAKSQEQYLAELTADAAAYNKACEADTKTTNAAE